MRRNLLTHTLAALLLCLVATAAIARPVHHHALNMSWLADMRDDKDGTPRGNLVLIVNGRHVTIAKSLDEHVTVLDPEQYKEHRVPTSAIAACSAWWGGAGDDFYVTRHGDRLRVYRRGVDEQEKRPERYKLVKSVRL